jgi:RecA-family ATPase
MDKQPIESPKQNRLGKDSENGSDPQGSITPDSVQNDTEKALRQAKESPPNLFQVKTGNEWLEDAAKRDIPEMLFSEFWHEGELCILFADANLGKSILAVQIGDSISRGKAIEGFRLGTHAQGVLYLDFELSEKQFENRYSIDYQNHFAFSDFFFRAEIDSDHADPSDANFSDFEAYLFHSLEVQLIRRRAKILIVDNITYLKQETEKARHALPLMKQLKALKQKHGLSILALAHTPKRDLSKPITKNDLQGSKMLINFCDSSFSIGESTLDKSMRYLKQIKARSTEIVFDAENVVTCLISKPSNFLQFEFCQFGTEREHLKAQTETEKASLEADILALAESEPNLSQTAIAERLGTHKMKVSRILKKHKS